MGMATRAFMQCLLLTLQPAVLVCAKLLAEALHHIMHRSLEQAGCCSLPGL